MTLIGCKTFNYDRWYFQENGCKCTLAHRYNIHIITTILVAVKIFLITRAQSSKSKRLISIVRWTAYACAETVKFTFYLTCRVPYSNILPFIPFSLSRYSISNTWNTGQCFWTAVLNSNPKGFESNMILIFSVPHWDWWCLKNWNSLLKTRFLKMNFMSIPYNKLMQKVGNYLYINFIKIIEFFSRLRHWQWKYIFRI